ncbi:MAG: hypothetical protein ACTSXX_12395 [Candidatus Baldrarchaeia archaeon]
MDLSTRSKIELMGLAMSLLYVGIEGLLRGEIEISIPISAETAIVFIVIAISIMLFVIWSSIK